MHKIIDCPFGKHSWRALRPPACIKLGVSLLQVSRIHGGSIITFYLKNSSDFKKAFVDSL